MLPRTQSSLCTHLRIPLKRRWTLWHLVLMFTCTSSPVVVWAQKKPSSNTPQDSGTANTSSSAQKSGADPEVVKLQKELSRLDALLQSSEQMFEDADGNQGAQIKILSSMTITKARIERLKARLELLLGQVDSEQNSPATVRPSSKPAD